MSATAPAEIKDASTAMSQAAPPPKKTSMTIINFWLDATLFVGLVTVVWITVMMKVVFPAPTTAMGWSLWGLTYDDWNNVQFYALCIAAALTVEHIVLHWNWVCTVLATKVLRRKRPSDASQAVYGVGTFIVLLLLVQASLITALFCVQHP